MPGPVNQSLLHLSAVDPADRFQKERRVMVKNLLQIGAVADRPWNQNPFLVQHPIHVFQRVTGMHQLLPLPFRQKAYPHSDGPFAGKHGPKSRPGVVLDGTAIVQRISGNIRQCIPDMTVILQQDGLGIQTFQDMTTLILMTKPLGETAFHFLPKAVRIRLCYRQNDGMTMVRDRSIDHEDDVFSPRTDGQILDHGVIILVVPTENVGFQAFQAEVEGAEFPDPPVRKPPFDNPIHRKAACER